MNNSLPRLIDGMVATLRKEVIPHIDGDFARGQAYGVIYVLNSIKLRAAWSNAFLSEQLRALEEAKPRAQDIGRGAAGRACSRSQRARQSARHRRTRGGAQCGRSTHLRIDRLACSEPGDDRAGRARSRRGCDRSISRPAIQVRAQDQRQTDVRGNLGWGGKKMMKRNRC